MRIALVVAGTFQCRSTTGREMLTAGSLLLGNDGECFECGHDHAHGDRCVSFGYEPEYFERLAADAGLRGAFAFRVLRVPPLRSLAPVVAATCARLVDATSPLSAHLEWEELSLEMAVQTLRVAGSLTAAMREPSRRGLARVTEVVRTIDADPAAPVTLEGLASIAGVSPYHFLRAFRAATGVTPHQYVLRARLRNVAARLLTEPSRVLDVALDCGFGDLSNFNHAFRAEFGMSPRAYRRTHAARSVRIHCAKEDRGGNGSHP